MCLDADMLKLYSDILSSENQCMKKDMTVKFGYLTMMAGTTLGVLNVESFYACVLSCVKLVVSDKTTCRVIGRNF